MTLEFETDERAADRTTGRVGAPTAAALERPDVIALTTLQAVLTTARSHGDRRPPFTVVAASLGELGIQVPACRGVDVSIAEARDEWLARVRSAQRSTSTLSAYRIALDDLLAYLDRAERPPDAFSEETIVAYLTDYQRRSRPAAATYYRHFMLLRRFYRWLHRRSGAPDPFLDLEPPGKPHTEADWLTPSEFGRLLAAAQAPRRARPGLAERDRLVLVTLVSTGLRRAELLALDWRDLDLETAHPSLLVRSGKGGKPRRQPLPPALAAELARRRATVSPEGSDAVFCGLEGQRLQRTILGLIIRRAAQRAGIDKHVTAHTLRHTAATWLRQATGDARLVAAYLGHSDLSTVSRYAHVPAADLTQAASALEAAGGLDRLAATPPEPAEETVPGHLEATGAP